MSDKNKKEGKKKFKSTSQAFATSDPDYLFHKSPWKFYEKGKLVHKPRKPKDDDERPIVDIPCSFHFPPCPEDLDFALQDVNAELFRSFCDSIEDGPTYLGPTEYHNVGRRFHVKGRFVGPQRRALVNLTCERTAPLNMGDVDRPVVNVTFVLGTGSAHTFLSDEAFSTLMGRSQPPEDPIYDFAVSISRKKPTFPFMRLHVHGRSFQDPSVVYRSPPQSRFAHANILGTHFMEGLILTCDYSRGIVEIFKPSKPLLK